MRYGNAASQVNKRSIRSPMNISMNMKIHEFHAQTAKGIGMLLCRKRCFL